MSNKKSSEELQSRREFFKKAAKAALPVVGRSSTFIVANPQIQSSNYECDLM